MTCPQDPNFPEPKDQKEPCKSSEKTASSLIIDTLKEIELPRFIRTGQILTLKEFIPSFVTYAIAALLGVTYFTDWKAVLQYVPIYGNKFSDDTQDEKKKKEKNEKLKDTGEC